jgi:hypothetical protein
MPTRKSRPKDEKPQFERFIETANKLEADETDEVLGCTIDKIVRPKNSTGSVAGSSRSPSEKDRS